MIEKATAGRDVTIVLGALDEKLNEKSATSFRGLATRATGCTARWANAAST